MSNLEYRALTTGTGIPLLENDVDTDRIIPARFMKCVTFEGLGAYAFYDVRFDESGKPKTHVLNAPEYKKGSILVTGRNFGCGSSREHAPQALQKYGIKAVIGESFAEIFAGNCTVLGIPCVRLSASDLSEIIGDIQKNPDLSISIDLEKKLVQAGEKSFTLEIKESYRKSLASGTWDSTAELLQNKPLIEKCYSQLPYLQAFN